MWSRTDQHMHEQGGGSYKQLQGCCKAVYLAGFSVCLPLGDRLHEDVVALGSCQRLPHIPRSRLLLLQRLHVTQQLVDPSNIPRVCSLQHSIYEAMNALQYSIAATAKAVFEPQSATSERRPKHGNKQ